MPYFLVKADEGSYNKENELVIFYTVEDIIRNFQSKVRREPKDYEIEEIVYYLSKCDTQIIDFIEEAIDETVREK